VDPGRHVIQDVNEQMSRNLIGYPARTLIGTLFADYFMDSERATAGVNEHVREKLSHRLRSHPSHARQAAVAGVVDPLGFPRRKKRLNIRGIFFVCALHLLFVAATPGLPKNSEQQAHNRGFD